MRKFLAMLMALTMLVGMGMTAQAAETAAPSYTYNIMMAASPLNWNPHAWEMNNESDLMTFTDLPLTDITIAEDGVAYKWIYEGADAVTDVTKDFADKEKWGIPADAEQGRAFLVDLNQNAKWANGEPINADTYIYSMSQLLDPTMKNYRSNNYLVGDSAIAGADKYFYADKAGQDIYSDVCTGTETYADVTDDKMFVDFAGVVPFFGDAFNSYYDNGYQDYYKNADGVDLYAKYSATTGYQPLTEEMKADLNTIAANFGDAREVAYKEFCSYVSGQYEAGTMEDVGVYKTGDYQFMYITANPVSMFNLLVSFTSNWIVYEPLYEAGKKTVENLVATDYATSLETTMCAGPYKMVSFEKDKQLVLERNENWFGYTDGKHEGQYNATRVKIDIVAEHNTALQLFNQGKLDDIELNSDDLTIYRMSDNLLKTDQTYTFRWIFGTSLESLTALEAEANDGANKKVLSYDDFRKALSLSMDRAAFCAQATAGYKPAFYLINYLYYTDIENDPNSQYRNTTAAKEAVLRLYGIEYGEGKTYATVDDAYAAVTGYDLDEAKALFQKVYEQAIKDGNYTDGQPVAITCMATAASSLTPDDTKQQDMMNQFVTEATKGTGFEGKITFTFKCGAKNRYDDVANGKIEMIRGAWGGAAFYPFSMMQCYCDDDYMGGLDKIHESNGWNPTVETLDIVYDFDGNGEAETVNKTYKDWCVALNNGEYAFADPDLRLHILSTMETGILSAYQCIPWAAETMCSLYSQKINMATLDYNIMYGYGGTRLMTFNYDDAAWDEYVASQGGTLSYE